MKRLVIVLLALATTTIACNLTDPPTPTPAPTQPPPPVLTAPMLGLNPVSGAPGTVINVGAAGFPTGARVNLYLSPSAEITTTTNPVARDLTIGPGGILSFAFQLPSTLGGSDIDEEDALFVTLATTDNLTRASSIFLPRATTGASPTTAAGGSTGGTGVSGLFITSPAINATVVGNAVVVTGSGRSLNSRVGVQVQNINNQVLGSATAIIQAGANTVGPWQVTVGFTQPTAAGTGYLVAFTLDANGNIAEQASIPVLLAGSGVATQPPVTAAPTATVPTVPPIITGGPTQAATQGGFITATP